MMMRMRLAWKKSQKTLDTSKRLHQNKTRSTGSVDKGLNYLDPNSLPSLGLRTQTSAGASLRVPTGVWNVLAGGRLQLGLKLWFPPDPRRRCSKFLNLNWWTWYNFLIMAHNEEPAVLWAHPFIRPPSRSRVYLCPFRGVGVPMKKGC